MGQITKILEQATTVGTSQNGRLLYRGIAKFNGSDASDTMVIGLQRIETAVFTEINPAAGERVYIDLSAGSFVCNGSLTIQRTTPANATTVGAPGTTTAVAPTSNLAFVYHIYGE